MVAATDNRRHELRPGMFVWVRIPHRHAEATLMVPPNAVVEYEGDKFVFVESAPGSYRMQKVTIGVETPEGVEVLSGLDEGTPVVCEGAFQIKSELLLEGEAE